MLYDALTQQDIDAIERHRPEAQSYLPKSAEQYQAELDAGTDPYSSRWFDAALFVGAVGIMGYAAFALVNGVA